MPKWEFEIGLVGLYKLLFRRKKCRECGGKLVRRTVTKPADSNWDWDFARNGLRFEWTGERYLCRFVYDCPECGTTSPLEEL